MKVARHCKRDLAKQDCLKRLTQSCLHKHATRLRQSMTSWDLHVHRTDGLLRSNEHKHPQPTG